MNEKDFKSEIRKLLPKMKVVFNIKKYDKNRIQATNIRIAD